jgi:hypothetical protein
LKPPAILVVTQEQGIANRCRAGRIAQSLDEFVWERGNQSGGEFEVLRPGLPNTRYRSAWVKGEGTVGGCACVSVLPSPWSPALDSPLGVRFVCGVALSAR